LAVRRLVAAALLLLSCGTTSVRAQALTFTFTPGAHYRYTLHETSLIDSTGLTPSPSKITLVLTAIETATVNSVDSAGTADITLALSGVTMKQTANGISSTTMTAVPSKEIRVGPDGRLQSINGKDVGAQVIGGMFGGAVLISALLPDHPVKPRDTWSQAFDIGMLPGSGGTGGVHVVAESTYLRDETIQGVDAAVVETKTTETIDSAYDPSLDTRPTVKGGSTLFKGSRTVYVTSWIDPGNHRVLKSQVKSSETISETIAVTQTLPAASYSYALELDPA
jgi:hypothetical protein